MRDTVKLLCTESILNSYKPFEFNLIEDKTYLLVQDKISNPELSPLYVNSSLFDIQLICSKNEQENTQGALIKLKTKHYALDTKYIIGYSTDNVPSIRNLIDENRFVLMSHIGIFQLYKYEGVGELLLCGNPDSLLREKV